jgi:hypothetical protein
MLVHGALQCDVLLAAASVDDHVEHKLVHVQQQQSQLSAHSGHDCAFSCIVRPPRLQCCSTLASIVELVQALAGASSHMQPSNTCS